MLYYDIVPYSRQRVTLSIHLMDRNLYPDMLKVNSAMMISRRWWEVVDRTTGKVVSSDD